MLRRLLRSLDLLLERAFVAVAFSQFLAFIQQYRQRLGGHIDEARRSLETVAAQDRATRGDAQEAIAETLGARVAELKHAYDAVFAAPVLLKPVVFLINVDPVIARGTAVDFAPQIPLDFASLVYAAIDLVLAALLYRGVSDGLFGRRRRRVKPGAARARRRGR